MNNLAKVLHKSDYASQAITYPQTPDGMKLDMAMSNDTIELAVSNDVESLIVAKSFSTMTTTVHNKK